MPTRTGAQQDIDALADIFATQEELRRYRFVTADIKAILPSNFHAEEAPQRDGLRGLRSAYGDLIADPTEFDGPPDRQSGGRGSGGGKFNEGVVATKGKTLVAITATATPASLAQVEALVSQLL